MRIWHQSFTVLEDLPAYAQALGEHFRRVASPGTEVVLHGMDRATYQTEYPGADIRYCYLLQLHAQQFLDAALQAEREGYDAFAIATLPDTGLQEARSLVEIPVVAYGETAMHVACFLGRRFGLLCFIQDLIPLFEENIRRYGLQERSAGVRHVGLGFREVLAGFAEPGPVVRHVVQRCEEFVRDGADVLVLGEAPLSILLAREGVTRIGEAPILDPLAALVQMAEALVALRERSGVGVCRRRYYFARPPAERLQAVRRAYGRDR